MEQACRRGISGVVERADPFISILSSPGCRRSRRATSIPVVYTLHFALHATKAVRKLTTRRHDLSSSSSSSFLFYVLDERLALFLFYCNWFFQGNSRILVIVLYDLIVNKKIFWKSMKENS